MITMLIYAQPIHGRIVRSILNRECALLVGKIVIARATFEPSVPARHAIPQLKTAQAKSSNLDG